MRDANKLETAGTRTQACSRTCRSTPELSWSMPFPSAFRNGYGEPALRRFFVFELHVHAGLPHGLDHLVK